MMVPHDRDVILASSSPRRRELLEQAGWRFAIVPPSESAECGLCSEETPPELVARLAFQKAADVAQRQVNRTLVIGCDTVACCHGQVLGKPRDEEDARRMLELLRGRKHQVYSGLCLFLVPENRYLVDVACTELMMDAVTEEQLEEYLTTRMWEGKAGAFGYQDGWDWLHIVSGSESNVVGLPMEMLDEMLGKLFGGS